MPKKPQLTLRTSLPQASWKPEQIIGFVKNMTNPPGPNVTQTPHFAAASGIETNSNSSSFSFPKDQNWGKAVYGCIADGSGTKLTSVYDAGSHFVVQATVGNVPDNSSNNLCKTADQCIEMCGSGIGK
jgi:hypothetical protein